MGNQLTGVAPSQILPVEQYLTDVPQFHFIEKYVLRSAGQWIIGEFAEVCQYLPS